MSAPLLPLANGECRPLADLPRLEPEALHASVVGRCAQGARLAALVGTPQDDGSTELLALLADDEAGLLEAGAARVEGRWRSLTPELPQAHWFERELWEQCGVEPVGHPWLKRIRFEAPLGGRPAAPRGRAGSGAGDGGNGGVEAPGVVPFFEVEGEEIHEVAVGPVHAGVIEPGHFRFQCHGEQVVHLEIELGYQHRGIERALVGVPGLRQRMYAETLAGDTTIGHALAHAELLEGLRGGEAPPRAQALRAIALELERMANHAGDLGALAGDVGFQPTAAACGRLRGDLLNLTALLCGSRFGRGLVRPGGVAFDLEPERAAMLATRLETALAELGAAVALLWDTAAVLERFEETGVVGAETARAIGLVGPAARAAGLERDVRFCHPAGLYRFAQLPVSTWTTGDVFGRAYVRWLELQRSAAFIARTLTTLPAGPLAEAALGDAVRPAPSSLAVALVEGWRGEIVHLATTDAEGRLARAKVVDPSFHNWFGLALALRGEAISDFPLCNKSFNLSYCGHDL